LITVLGSASGLWAAPPRPPTQPNGSINRDILGLYDSATEDNPAATRLHRFLEMPLNHLGYRLTLHDIAKGLPSPDQVKQYRAVATWFSGRVTQADTYLAWATALAKADNGPRFLVLDSPGMIGLAPDLPSLNKFLAALGLTQAEYYVADTQATQIAQIDHAMLNAEARLNPAALPAHTVFIVHKTVGTHKRPVTVHLSLKDPAHKWVQAPEAAMIVTSARGGFIAPGFAIAQSALTNRLQWMVDPFRFLAAALGTDFGKDPVPAIAAPVPDTTTVSGRRLYFSHIDGDGWNNATDVEPFAAEGRLAADVVLERLIKPYPDLPVSVGLIAGDANPADGGMAQAAVTARAMYALPQVEVASHTHTHPFYWSLFETYRRDREISQVLATVAKNPSLADRSLTAVIADWRKSDTATNSHVGGQALTATVPAVDPRPDLPRARPHQPFMLEREVAAALRAASDLAPAGKRAQLYLWSGDCRPFEAALRAARLAGVRNLNGGDSRFDASYPSLMYVPPLSRMVGAERQIYAVNSNENTYTNGWTGPFDGFSALNETLDNTELPRRLKGFNLYYHSFSATRRDGLEVVQRHLDRARASPVAPISAARYAAIADGFFSTSITANGIDRWQISNRGGLQTMRFDQAAAIEIDDEASVGVIGYNQHAGALYIALDSAVPDATIAVRRQSPSTSPASNTPASTSPGLPHLVESRWRFANVKRQPCSVTADVEGFGVGEMTWGGFKPGNHTLTVTRGGVKLASQTVPADSNGRLTARIEISAIEPAQLQITCGP
jgi:polysaccharide biosynthesis protein PelA